MSGELTSPDPHKIKHIFRWDLDKTYLATDFDSLSSLLRIPFESAEEKVNVPGAAALLQCLTGATAVADESAVYFISGSPQQMETVLREKLALDGIAYHSLSLKPNLKNLTRGRFRAIKEQVGYKLPLLLEGRIDYLPGTTETLFGDDAESDGFIYALYGAYMAGRVPWSVIEAVFEECRVYDDAAEAARNARNNLILDDCVETIFINLDRKSSPARFSRFSKRIVPIYNYWQAALVLQSKGRLSAGGSLLVAGKLQDTYGYTLPRLRNSVEDLLRRQHLTRDSLAGITESLTKLSPERDHQNMLDMLTQLVDKPPPVLRRPDEDVPTSPEDYIELFRAEKAARKAAKHAVMQVRKETDREEQA